MKEEVRYCAFIDVLGYRNIVQDEKKSTSKKIKILSEIYSNLFSSVSMMLKDIHTNSNIRIFSKSFSDCIYLESTELEVLLFACYQAYNITFNFNYNFGNEKYTPLLRGGLVKDWTLHFMDVSSLERQNIDDVTRKNDEYNYEFYNPVGLGITRSYLISEKSGLSGMRLLISPEALNNIVLSQDPDVDFECYSIKSTDYSILKRGKELFFYLTPIRINEAGATINLYELCWPAMYSASYHNKLDVPDLIKQLFGMENNFTNDNLRHYKKTTEIIKKAFFITLVRDKASFTPEEIDYYLYKFDEIERM